MDLISICKLLLELIFDGYNMNYINGNNMVDENDDGDYYSVCYFCLYDG